MQRMMTSSDVAVRHLLDRQSNPARVLVESCVVVDDGAQSMLRLPSVVRLV